MEYEEEEYLTISGIQHFAFCRRQWALANIEMQWAENLRTTEGHILHKRAHDVFLTEKRGNVLISRGLSVFSRTLGVNGTCDVVEFHACKNGVEIVGRDGTWIPIPVEYKRGSPKESDADRLQICCQAMCLEEMLACSPIEQAFLYYRETAHRSAVLLDEGLRSKVKSTTEQMHELYKRKHTPRVKPSKGCNACSLKDLCLPQLYRNHSATAYIKQQLHGEAE